MLNYRCLTFILLITLSPLLSLYAQNGSEASNRIRVVTYNITAPEDIDSQEQIEKIAKLIKQINPDLVAFQGISNTLQRSGDIELVKSISEKTGLEMAISEPDGEAESKMRLGILSRYPIKQKATMRIAGDQDGSPRYLLGAEVAHPVIGAITFGSVEIEFDPESSNSVLQSESVNRAFDDDFRNKAMIACSIFAQPKDKALKVLKSNWVDASKDYEQLTYPASNPNLKADYIFLKKNSPWKVLASRVMNVKNLNIHLPVVLDLEWSNE